MELNANLHFKKIQRQWIKDRYLVDDGRDLDANRDALDKVCGDRSFTCPTKELVDIYSRHGIRTYFYYLTYRASTEVWPPWMGVIHGADIQVCKRCCRWLHTRDTIGLIQIAV